MNNEVYCEKLLLRRHGARPDIRTGWTPTDEEQQMTSNRFSKQELAAIVQATVREMLNSVSGGVETTPTETEDATVLPVEKRRRGRPKSEFKGQLHLSVLPEDEDWFKDSARGRGITNGKMFSLLRSRFEQTAIDNFLNLGLSDLDQ